MVKDAKQAVKNTPKKPHYAGHRSRLRKRFREQGGTALPDYELLEMLLYRALPQKDTKPLAKELLDTFGSFTEVLHASPERLKEISGIGESVVTELKLVEAAAVRLARAEIEDTPILDSIEKLIKYCTLSMAHDTKEQFRILFLDKKNKLIKDEVQQTGTIDHTPVYPREVVKRALELSATALILVHNHPSGDPTPSRADIDMTSQVIAAAKTLNIVVHDHIIIGKKRAISFRELRLL